VRNAQKFSKAIADNSDNIDKFLASVGQLGDTFKTVSTKIDSTLDAVEKLVRAVDAQKVNDVIANADRITANVADATTDLKATIASFKQTADTYNTFGQKAQQTLDRVDAIVAQIDPAKIKGSVDDIADVTKQARTAVASIRDVANSVAAHQQDIDQTIANARDISTKLNSASGKVDGILTKVDSLLGSDSTQSLFAEAKDTLESFKKVADNLNARIGPIADNLQKFSSSGLRDAQTLINDMRGTVDNLNTTITNFDKNPQRLIFGGDTVKTYDGRARH
jgi:phospholipid/cholesterol/gamma-HCH transport system substrate-binding protein